MIVALRLEVNIIASCILFILIHNKMKMEKSMLDERLYQLLLYTTFLYAFADSSAWVIDGSSNSYMMFALYFTNILCYLFCVFVPYVWSLYAECRLFEDEVHLKAVNRYLCIPVIIYTILVIATPWTGWMFSFNGQQVYQRGPLFILQVILTLGYAIYPTLRALYKLKTTTLATQRRECYNIALFIVLPLIGMLIQVFVYGLPTAIVTIVIAELIIFINVQNKQISIDALTSLNNRGHLNRYLHMQIHKENHDKMIYMLIIDIDFFKSINDTYGHRMGDLALIDMAGILQNICGKWGGFLARYGGDEFSIIIEKNERQDILDFIQDIKDMIDIFNQTSNKPYQLSASVGYAQYDNDHIQTMDQLIEAADQAMYQMKLKRHNESL